MFKKLFFFSFCIIVPAFAMESSNWPEKVKRANSILVTTASGETYDIAIQSDSTILDVKNKLFDNAHMPVAQQQLLLADTSTNLKDEEKVKDIMATHNTPYLVVQVTKLQKASQKKGRQKKEN